MNHDMLPLSSVRKTKRKTLDSLTSSQKTLQLQYGHINHNQIKPHCTLEIAKNLVGCPINFKSGQEEVIDKDFSLVFYQSIKVHLSYSSCDQMIICLLHFFVRSYFLFFIILYYIGWYFAI
jgi:hypothetical protein